MATPELAVVSDRGAKLIARSRRRREKHQVRKGPDAEPRSKYLPSRQLHNRPFDKKLTKGFDNKVRQRKQRRTERLEWDGSGPTNTEVKIDV